MKTDSSADEARTSSTCGGDDRTYVTGDLSGEDQLSIEELRQILDLTDGNRINAYGTLSTIGFGGHGAVFAAREPGLNREVALKILRPEFRGNPRYLESFIREARITAQIGHPNIIPVHHLGIFDDVGVYFTMKRVEGETLRSMLKKLQNGDPEYRRKYSLNRRLEIFLAIGQGVAYAHSRGVLHRDLKPSNIMLGDYGEVLVMDWGLAQYRAEKDTSEGISRLRLDAEIDVPDEEELPASQARISGTPAFMAPEQALGLENEVDEKSDQYGLGTILYSLLTLENAPFDASLKTSALLKQVINGRFVPPRRRAPKLKIPRELEAIVLKAMARHKEDRYSSVEAMLEDVRNFMDKYPVSAYSPPPFYRLIKLCSRHPLIPMTMLMAGLILGGFAVFQKIDAYYQGRSLLQMAEYSMEKGELNLRAAERAYQQLNRNPDQATELIRFSNEFINYDDAAFELLSQAERLGYDLPGIHRLIGRIIDRELEFFLKTENYSMLESRLQQARSRRQVAFNQIIAFNPALRQKIRQLRNATGTLEITTIPPSKLLLQDEEGRVRPLGESPLTAEIPAGNYRLSASAPGYPPIQTPLSIRSGAVNRIELELPNTIPAGTVYIPAGEFYLTNRSLGVLEKMRLPGFFIARNEVTFGDYLPFWRQLKTPAERNRYRARIVDRDTGEVVELWDDQGRLRAPYRPELPVVGITGEAAAAFCRYLGERLGLTCRLPTAAEWEKAARGSDSREYVWGDEYVPGKALLADHPEAAGHPAGAAPGSFPEDTSRPGVSDLTGNVRELVTEPELGPGYYAIKGGSFATAPVLARCGHTDYTAEPGPDLGFRYVVEFPSRNPAAEEPGTMMDLHE